MFEFLKEILGLGKRDSDDSERIYTRGDGSRSKEYWIRKFGEDSYEEQLESQKPFDERKRNK